MRVRVGYDLASDCPEVAPMVPEVTAHYRAADLVVPEHIVIEPPVPVTTYRDGFGNCTRLASAAGRIRMSARAPADDSGELDRQTNATCQSAAPDLPPEVLVFLLAPPTAIEGSAERGRNASVERFIGSIWRECLDHVIVWGAAGASAPHEGRRRVYRRSPKRT